MLAVAPAHAAGIPSHFADRMEAALTCRSEWSPDYWRDYFREHLGQPLRDFAHDRAPLFATSGDPRRESDDGMIRAAYGDVSFACNLGDVPRTVGGVALPPYGFRADAPGLAAGLAPDGTGYVTETRKGKTDLWLYAPSQAKVSVPVPLSGRVTVALDGEMTRDARPATRGVSYSLQPTAYSLSLTLPQRGSIPRVAIPADRAGLAPRDWPGAKPAIGVLDLGEGVPLALSTVTPAAWRAAFESSALAKQHGLPVKSLASYEELAAALAAGSSKFFAIVNPYGEIFPAPGAGRWREALDAVRNYVNNGGAWWETAAYSFHRAAYREGGTWKTEPVGGAGLDHLRLPIGSGEVDQPAEQLHATEAGKAWLGDALAARIAEQASSVNRAVPSTDAAPATVLVGGVEAGFIGGYRLDGWGYLWRVGGFSPNPEVTPAVAVAATLHQYTALPAPPPACGTRYLYHATLTPDSWWQRVKALF